MLKASWLICAVCLASLPAPAAAQDQTADPGAVPPSVDAGDLWRHVRHHETEPEENADDTSNRNRPFFVVAPAVTSKPSTGMMVGAATTLAFTLGDPDSTHLSSASANAKVSVKGQVLSSLRYGVFSASDRWFVQGDNRFQWTSLNIYDSGFVGSVGGENVKYNWFRVYETAYHRARPHLFIGLGLNINDHSNVRPASGAPSLFGGSQYALYSDAHGLAADRQVSSGTNVGLLFDTRDNAINARRGWLASATYRTFFDGFLGGDSTWQELNVDVRTYRRLSRNGSHRVAFWLLGDVVAGGTAPYLDLPSTSGDLYGRSARGYAEGRYRGPHLLYGEVEYRGTLTPNGLVGMVAFLNATTVDAVTPGATTPAPALFRSVAPGGGMGLRFLLDKRSRTNLCADYGVGRQGSRGFYLAIQEAF